MLRLQGRSSAGWLAFGQCRQALLQPRRTSSDFLLVFTVLVCSRQKALAAPLNSSASPLLGPGLEPSAGPAIWAGMRH